MENFDLEKALKGAPIETRNGCKAKIIDYDNIYDLNLEVEIEFPAEKKTLYYSENGKYNGYEEPHEWDLVMAEKAVKPSLWTQTCSDKEVIVTYHTK